MTKELFVSSTPHETKLGLVEDDQLAEIYLERENEYTLAGSIYKGRVTRVLPGMQSAFVDIGLERDAFLYVSDFMELEEQDEDVTEVIPTPRTGLQDRAPQPRAPRPPESAAPAAPAGGTYVIESEPFAETERQEPAPAASEPNHNPNAGRDRGWRGRRRRRSGRRGDRYERGERDRAPAESRRSAGESQTLRRDPDYGPPPGYQPILLPGESISKYRQRPTPNAVPGETQGQAAPTETGVPVSSAFPEDEPLFAGLSTEPLHEHHDPHEEALHQEWEREHELHDRTNLTAAFRGEAPAVTERHLAEPVPAPVEPEVAPPAESFPISAKTKSGTIEEQEIEEEEADLSSYGEATEEDESFEELEEETRAAEDYQPHPTELAAAGEADAAEPPADTSETTTAQAFPAEAEAGAEDEAEEDSEEAEIENAQAEAEALLEAEARGNGTAEARAEVRAPSSTAGYTQRAVRRPEFDRRRGRRGGRRFRSGPRRENSPVPQISDLLKEGQEVLIQIAKEPIGKKGARITSHIALPGRFLVYMPTVNHTGVSRKIASDEERQRLKRIIISERENGQGGFIVRTAAAGASEDELRADIRFLKNLWHEIKTRSEESKSPSLIYHDLNVVERVLRDQVTSDFSAIWVDTEQEYERILRFANRFQPALVRRVKLYTKETPLFEQFGLKEEIDKALKSKVWLKSGGYIVINQTEALVAIDVNTGKYVGKTARLEDTIVKTNVDAIREIVRQIRLRDLGGIIVIDFIDMDERRNRQRVMQALEEELRNDRAPSKVLQFNDFGLVAITRKRVKQSLERTIGSPCPYCQATGFVKSVTTVCNEIYVEMRKSAKHLERPDVMLRVNPEVAKALKAQNGKWLNEMEELTKRTVIVKSDPALHIEQFDIN
ncbi:MAG TPA: Rne/Rng family ribonuclease [Terriglobales bacterium]|nr:Rne/Rng family ribonuclease [Terriglobales bacterium]